MSALFPKFGVKDTILPCGLKAVTTWVAIKLVDKDDKPVPGAKYHIVFPDGTEKTDNLDKDGYAYFDGIPPGDCSVGFPEFSPFFGFLTAVTSSRRIDELRAGVSGIVSGAQPSQPGPPVSITVELQDEAGKGMDGEAFQIELPNGDIARGFLEANGKKTVQGIEPGGDCKIRFPAIAAEFVKFVESK